MSEAAAERKPSGPMIVGRYALFDELAAGGMATVHLARLLVDSGPGRTVAVKRLHSQYTTDNEFCTMFMDEARLVTRIKHPNCVRTVDIVQNDAGLFLVMEYVHGESLSRLMRTSRERKEPIPPKLVATLIHNALLGLHAAHEVSGEDGKPLNVVHRDVSPQNIIVGVDGAAKVLDFGIAKAAGRMQTTREGQIKGKLAYMAPEQIRGQVDRRTDVFAAAVCLWEALASRRLHEGLKDVEIVTRVVQGKFVAPSTYASGIPHDLDQIVLKGLAADPKKRYSTAKEMASEIESKIGLVSRTDVGKWVEKLAKATLDKRAAKVAAMEQAAMGLRPSPSARRLPMPSTPDGFEPVSVIEATANAKTATSVAEELDSVAPTITPPAYTPEADVAAAAKGNKPPPPASNSSLRTPASAMAPVRVPPPPTPAAPASTRMRANGPPPSPTKTGPHRPVRSPPSSKAAVANAPVATPPAANAPIVNAPVGAPVPNVAVTPPGPNDTGHTQLTPSGTEVPVLAPAQPQAAPAPRRSVLLYALVGVALLFALAGAALGGYALARRAPPPAPPTVTAPPVTSVTTPLPEPSPTTQLSATPPSTASAASATPAAGSAVPATSAAAATSASNTTAVETVTPSASASGSAPASASVTATPPPTTTTTPTPTAAPKEKPKPKSATCDPPYTLDENGNQKYKAECMGL